MPIEVMNTRDIAEREKRRTKIFSTHRVHAWVHYYKPGQHDDLHCHNEDQTFYVIDGECTMFFPDGEKSVLRPGMLATITGGSFYRIENCAGVPMVMLGTRSGSEDTVKAIDYATRREIKFVNGVPVVQ